MIEDEFILRRIHRKKIENKCEEHASHRKWNLAAVKACSNHVHLAVEVGDDFGPKKVRDQFKANATICLKQGAEPVERSKFWTKGGDVEVIESDDDWEAVQIYILEAQDRMASGK